MNIFSVKLVALLNDISVWWHVIGVVVIVGFLIFKPDHHQSVATVFGHTINNSGFSHSWLWFVLLLGLLQAQYTYTGYDASAHMSEETQDAGRSAARGVIMSIVVSAVFGYILALGVTFAIQDITATAGAGGFAVKQVFLDSLGTRTAEVMLFITVGAQLYCGMSSITSASRMMYAFSRDGATPGHRLWRRLNAPAGAGLLGARDRRAGVPLCVPGLLRDERRRRLRGGHLDRDDRPLHRLRDPDLPAAAPRRCLGAGRVEPRQPLQGDRDDRLHLGGVHLGAVHHADHAEGIPFKHGFTWVAVNYAPIAVVGTFLLVGGWWLLSAHKWFKGPIAQGSEEELERIEVVLRRGSDALTCGVDSAAVSNSGGSRRGPAPSVQQEGTC